MYKKGVSFCSDKKGDKKLFIEQILKNNNGFKNIDFIVFCTGFILSRKYFVQNLIIFFYYFKSNYHAQNFERFNWIRPVPIKIT